MPFKSRRHILAECVDLIIPGFGTMYIAVFEDNEGTENLAQNPVCTSNLKHIDVRPPFLRELISLGEIFGYSSLSS